MSPAATRRLPGLIVLTLGITASVLAHRLPAQTGFGLGSAFLPFWTGLLLAACGLWLCVRLDENAEVSWPGYHGMARAGVGFVILLFYTLALEPLGYLLSTAGFLVGGMLLLEPKRPLWALFLGIASASFLILIFRIWLRVPLPGGLVGW